MCAVIWKFIQSFIFNLCLFSNCLKTYQLSITSSVRKLSKMFDKCLKFRENSAYWWEFGGLPWCPVVQTPLWRADRLRERLESWAILPFTETVDHGLTSSKHSYAFCGLLILKPRMKT